MSDDPITRAVRGLLGRVTGRGRRRPQPEPGERIVVLPTVRVVAPDPSLFGAGRVRRGRAGTVYDSPRVGKDGKRPTHRVDMMADPLSQGMSIDDYEAAVLARRGFPSSVQRVESRLDALDPDVADAYQRLRAGADSAGVRLGVRETLRPRDRQKWLFQQGRSRPGWPITWTLTSNHEEGRALDLIADAMGYRWLDENAGRYGFNRLADDPPHIEMPRPRGREQWPVRTIPSRR